MKFHAGAEGTRTSPQNMPLSHKNYFELKTLKTQEQEGLWRPFLSPRSRDKGPTWRTPTQQGERNARIARDPSPADLVKVALACLHPTRSLLSRSHLSLLSLARERSRPGFFMRLPCRIKLM